MSSPDLVESLIYTEINDDAFESTQEDIEEFAKRVGIEIEKEPHLIYLAREGLQAKLPEPWKPCLDKARNAWFYYNTDTQRSQWEHPMNLVYRDKVIQARADLAMNRLQSFDPLTSRPPKSLPPLKKSGTSLAPINSAASSLGKLGGISPAAGDLRQGMSQPKNSLNTSNNAFNQPNNNKPFIRQNASANIISSSSLNSSKDLNGDDSPPLIRPQQQKKSGLTLTGGGANFLKGSGPSSDGGPPKPKGGTLFNPSSQDRMGEEISDPEFGGGSVDKKPYKSILVNSFTRSRPTNPSDNVYDLDGFSINPDEMTDNEKMVFSQLESSSSKSKGNVKFNLDENTELKFEMSGDENEDIDEDAYNKGNNDEDDDDETEEDEDSSKSSKRNEQDQDFHKWIPNNSGDSNHTVQKAAGSFNEYSDAAINAMKTSMRDEMEEELTRFKEQLEMERKSRQEQIQKHLDETVTQFKSEKEETLKRIRKEMESEKNFEVDKAKREIDGLLQKEVEEMKAKFEETLRQRQQELAEDYRREDIDEDTYNKENKDEGNNDEEWSKNSKRIELDQDFHKWIPNNSGDSNHTVQKAAGSFNEYSDAAIDAMKKAMRDEMEEELTRFKEQLDMERKSRQEQIQKHLDETVTQFRSEKEETLKRIRKEMESEKNFEVDKAKREIDGLLQKEVVKMKTKFEKALQKRQQELDETVTQFRSEKEETLKRIRKEMESEKNFEIDKAKREIDGRLEKEVEKMKAKFEEALQRRQEELEDDYRQKTVELLAPQPQPQLIPRSGRSVPVLPEDSSGPHSEPISEDTHLRIVEEAKAFIRMQKNRLNDPSPIPSATHLIPKTKNNLLLFDDKLLKSVTPRRPAAVHLDLLSETESSGVSSLKDHRSSESKKLSRDIDKICNSLNNLDHQMKMMWSVVKGKQQDESFSLLHSTTTPSTAITALLPNSVPIILGKSRVSASLPASARKPLAPPTSPNNQILTSVSKAGKQLSSRNYSGLLTRTPNSSSQTVLDALRMSGLSTSRLDCSDLLLSLEEELKEFKTTKQKLLEFEDDSEVPGNDRKIAKHNYRSNPNTNSILEKTKDLQEWIKKY